MIVFLLAAEIILLLVDLLSTAGTDSVRLLSIDILRTAAIGMMVLVHFVENLSSHYGLSSTGPASREHLWWLPVGLAAPLYVAGRRELPSMADRTKRPRV